MSTYENRIELWGAAQASIDRVAGDLQELAERLQATSPDSRLQALAAYVESTGFEVEWGSGAAGDSFVARRQHFNAEDMRKGLRHGHVAVAACIDTSRPTDLVAGVAAATGIAATLGPLFGQISLIALARASDLPTLCEEGCFSLPDCTLTFKGSADGNGFQHTIANSGNHLAGATLEVTAPDGDGIAPDALRAFTNELNDDLGEHEAVVATPSGIQVQASRSTRVAELAERVRELVRSSGAGVDVVAGPIIPEMVPSRLLARRIKSFADTLLFKGDPIHKAPPAEPTPWGPVSHEVATAIVRYPLTDDLPDDVQTALTLAKAASGAGLDVLGDMEFRGFVDGERVRALNERGLKPTPRRWLGVHPVLPPQDARTRRVNIPDVIVRGPGVPEPTLEELIDDETS